jgi:hypothetical protein
MVDVQDKFSGLGEFLAPQEFSQSQEGFEVFVRDFCHSSLIIKLYPDGFDPPNVSQ